MDKIAVQSGRTYDVFAPLKETGIGLRSDHYRALQDEKPDIGWIEVHPENYFGGGVPRQRLHEARTLYPLSFHAVGLSLGSDQDVEESHLAQIKELIDLYDPFQVSDHVSWSASGNAHLNDLLPLPYTQETVLRLQRNIDRTQTYFGRQILVENPSSYIAFAENDMSEAAFMNALADKTGCGLLLDINNIYVQANNHGFDAYDYLDEIKRGAVQEMHLAGHSVRDFEDGKLLVDTHDAYVCDDVWALYKYAVSRFGKVRTLIEWDSDLPPLAELVGEADKAQAILDACDCNAEKSGDEYVALG